MRINKYLAQATGMSRRKADEAILQGRVLVNGQPTTQGWAVTETDTVTLDGRVLTPVRNTVTIMLNKPVGYVVSRNGQGSRTIYDLLPPEYHQLKPIGRLDKDSSGLLLLTNDGQLTQELTHPRYQKIKIYEVEVDKPLTLAHRQIISGHGVELDDGNSRLVLDQLKDGDGRAWRITMHEGRNRQIRRTFAALGYKVTKLHRTRFGEYQLSGLPSGKYKTP